MSSTTTTAAPRTPARTPARDLAVIAVFAGVTAALGFLPLIPIPWSPAPITAQSFGVILAGAVLGSRRGLASQALFLALVALGLPLLAGGRGGLGVFSGPSVGFLVGYVLCAGIIGLLTERFGAPYRVGFGIVANIIGGIVCMDIFGILGFLARTKLSLGGAIVACGPFLVGDLIKCVLAAFVAAGVHRAYPGLLRTRRLNAPQA